MNYWVKYIVASTLLLVGCNSTSVISATSSPSEIVTQPAPYTQMPAQTPVQIIEATEVKSYTQEIKYQCVVIKEKIMQTDAPTGRIVLNGDIIPTGKGKRISNPSLLIDLSSGAETILSTDKSTNRIVVSPNGNYLAFNTSANSSLYESDINFLDANGNLLSRVETDQSLPFIEWLNETTLLMDNLDDQQNPLIAINPLDRKETDIKPFITQSERLVPFDGELIYDWGFYAYHKIIYDPTFKRAIYATYDESGPHITFRDLTSNKDVSNLKSNEAWGISPKWSPEGEKIAISMNINKASISMVSQYEIMVFEKNGGWLYTTHIASPDRPSYIPSLAWSPDGQSIAFWYTTDKDVDTNLRLAVFDIQTHTTTDYCITKNTETYMWHRNDTSPIWSPDSKYLLVQTANSEDVPNVIAINLAQADAKVIKTGYEPIGWMRSP